MPPAAICHPRRGIFTAGPRNRLQAGARSAEVLTMLPAPPAADPRPLRSAGLLFAGILLAALAFQRSPLGGLPGSPSAYGNAPGDAFRCLFAAGLLVAFARGFRVLRDHPDTTAFRRPVVGFGVAFVLIGLAVPPVYSTDLFSNVNIGWTLAGHGLNPLVASLVEVPGFLDDPVFRVEPVWLNTPCAYGPLFVHVAAGLCRLGGGDGMAMAWLFKAFGAGVFGLTAWVVWTGARRMNRPCPERALYLFLWNPLLLVHGVIDGHNDLWMALLTAVGVYWAVGGGWRLAAAAVVLGVLVKYISAATLPFLALYVARRVGWRRSLAGVAGAGVVGVLVAWPLVVDDWTRIPFDRHAANAGAIIHSVPAMVLFPFEVARADGPAVRAAIKYAFLAAFAAVYAWLAARRLRGRDYAATDFVWDGVLIQFLLACVVSTKFYPWYLGMFFPLALWLPEGGRLRRVVLAVTCAQVAGITFLGHTRFLEAYLLTVTPILWACGVRVRLPAWVGRRVAGVGAARPGLTRTKA